MYQATILALPYSLSSCITGLMDVLCATGIDWNLPQQFMQKSAFDVKIVSLDGQPVKCINRMPIIPHCSLGEISDTDLIFIPSMGLHLRRDSQVSQYVLPWLHEHFEKGASIAGLCTGSFILAETGLLDGKDATTHWACAQQFQERYPQVRLHPERIMTDAGRLFCSGGNYACFDLAFYLIEKFCGYETAASCAKTFVLDLDRTSQNPYVIFRAQKSHKDQEILAVQEWLEVHYANIITLEEVANRAAMSTRNFKRRFKKATGDSLVVYLQRLRVDAAKKELENFQKSIEEIGYALGYENIGFFRKLFKRYTGLSPNHYRQKLKNRQISNLAPILT
ncbi:MAG: helix-turn-helix domain-containing protein [SAR324 cluster bacterium]|nr:helix-turn-helix domain-containing protein [SAR324 cluster bacterium]